MGAAASDTYSRAARRSSGICEMKAAGPAFAGPAAAISPQPEEIGARWSWGGLVRWRQATYGARDSAVGPGETHMPYLHSHRMLAVAGATCLAATAVFAVPATAEKPRSGSSTGTGQVFKVNPVQSSGDQSLTDQKDAAGAVPGSAYAQVQLRNLDGSGRLIGRWVNVRSSTGDAAYSPTNTFLYNRHDDRFEQVMAYFWVNEAQEYLQSLGFGSSLRPVNAESQDVRLNQYGIDNSFSWDKHDYIRLGKGGVDDAEDAEVIVHEYGHAVHDAQVPGYGASLDAGAIGEAFGDYLAVTVGLSTASRYGWPVLAPEPCVADWDSISYTSTVPHCLRRIDSGLVLEDRRNQVHYDGMIWSQALWDIRQRYVALGLTTRDWDRTLIDSQFGYAPDTSFSEAAEVTYQKALDTQGAAVAAAVRAGFAARHIYF
ncbi:Bacillolysin [metagenome]|uniref:Bacillolysin n=1 Tax=metagenome TaxID=256318 RepID=A0A2P2C5P1_9ZZZZ